MKIDQGSLENELLNLVVQLGRSLDNNSKINSENVHICLTFFRNHLMILAKPKLENFLKLILNKNLFEVFCKLIHNYSIDNENVCILEELLHILIYLFSSSYQCLNMIPNVNEVIELLVSLLKSSTTLSIQINVV